ncbi:MAG: hypothetical protein K8I30_01835, partial [Anaerolineae bacterium]|nr:hypothetical protein [Anaerolineae bacterium]
NGQVEIKNIAREAGYRSKVAVAALQEGIDPVGACVGMRGIRIQNIVKELHEEKIDVIEWNSDQHKFIEKALSPARTSGVYLEDDPDSGRTAVVIVPDDQLSLAIGREGQNARLAAKLTGWRIDIKSVTEAVQDALNNLDTPILADLPVNQPELLEEIRRIMDKKVNSRAVMPEEFTLLGKFADLVEKRLVAKRDTARQARLAEINAVKSTLPQQAFKQPIGALDLPEDILEALLPLENVGEIMWRFLIDEDRLRRLLGDLPADSLAKVQAALDRFVMPEDVEPAAEVVDEAAALAAAAVEVAEAAEAVDDELAPAAFPDEPVVEIPPVDRGQPARKPLPPRKEVVPAIEADTDEEDEDDVDLLLTGGKKKEKKKKKKERQQRRQLIFDEEIGQVIAKRRRKGGRGDSWDDEE